MSVSGPGDLGYTLLPPDPGIVGADLALDAALAPVVDYQAPAEQPYGKGWRFDFLANQFVRNGGAPAEAYELDNLAMWCEKTLRTARLAHPIYSDQYGMDDPFALIGFVADGAALSAYQQAIQTALVVHDRIVAVENFSFSQAPLDDGVFASFTVVLDAAGSFTPETLEFTDVPVA